LSEYGVHERNTVDHVEDVVVALDGFSTAHHHAGGAANAAGASVDGHTSNLSVERVYEIDILPPEEFLGGDLLYVVTQSFFLTFDTESRDHDFVDGYGGSRQFDVEMGLSRVGDLLCFVAQKGHNNHIVWFQVGEGEIPVHAGCNSVRTVLDRYGGTYYRAVFISYNTTDIPPPSGRVCADPGRVVSVFRAAKARTAMQHLNNDDVIVFSIIKILVNRIVGDNP
jgi:hypothetical protein